MPSGGIRRRRMTRRSEIRCERRRISVVASILQGPRPRRQSESIPANRVRRMATVPVRRSVLEWVVSPPGRTARRSRGEGQGRLRVKTGQCHGTLGIARISDPAEPIRLSRQLLLWPGARHRRRAGVWLRRTLTRIRGERFAGGYSPGLLLVLLQRLIEHPRQPDPSPIEPPPHNRQIRLHVGIRKLLTRL
jgi:hypothetical protein